MTATVIPMVSKTDVDAAWAAYAAHTARMLDEPRLLIDRAFMEEHRRLHRRFNALFDRTER